VRSRKCGRGRFCAPETSRDDQSSGLAIHMPKPFSRGGGIYLLCAGHAGTDRGSMLCHLQRRTPERYHPGRNAITSISFSLDVLYSGLEGVAKLARTTWEDIPDPISLGSHLCSGFWMVKGPITQQALSPWFSWNIHLAEDHLSRSVTAFRVQGYFGWARHPHLTSEVSEHKLCSDPSLSSHPALTISQQATCHSH
jgi:hypothetical protein